MRARAGRPDTGWPRGRAAAAAGGLCSAAFALGLAELTAGFAGTSPVIAVGNAMVDHAPGWLKDFAIRRFGSDDKLVLIIGVSVVLAVLAALAGLLARRALRAGSAVVVMLGAVGALAAATDPAAGPLAVAPSIVAAVAGVVALWVLFRERQARAAPPGRQDAATAAVPRDRRAVLAAGTGMVVVAAAGVLGGRTLQARRSDVASARTRIRLPAPDHPAPPLPAGYRFDVPGLAPFITSNDDFYRVDTDLLLPRVDPRAWTLRVTGSVDRPVELSYHDLLRRPLIERDLTVCCVSNPVGGPYVGTARFLGVSLADVLRDAGVHTGADEVLSRSADGITIGTPTELITDGRDALLAVGMNGRPLPVEHGFPVRMLVPGLYGYASATKWLTELRLTTFAGQQAYWVRRGYVEVGAAKTASRIDVPAPSTALPAGPTTVAGIAWSLHRGISAVQYRVDGGSWHDAQLTSAVGPDVWRQWRARWHATPGSHRIEARAADGEGNLQPGRRMAAFPSGATGWPSVAVTVSGE